MNLKKIYCDIAGYNKVPQNKYPFCFRLEGQPRMESGTWLFDGDSIFHTMNMKTWFGLDATNFAVGGSTTDDVLARIQQVKDRKPRRIVSSIGGNDVLRFHPTKHICDNFREILTTYKSITPHVYQCSIPWLDVNVPGSLEDLEKLLFLIFSGFIKNYDSSLTITSLEMMLALKSKSYNIPVFAMNILIQKICKEMDVIYIDTNTILRLNYNQYKYDGIHPNPYGIAKEVQVIKTAIITNEGFL